MLLPILASGPRRRLLMAAAAASASLRFEPARRLLLTSAACARISPSSGVGASLRSTALSSTRLSPLGGQPVRWGGGGDHHGPRKMIIQPTRHNWDHFWDDVHYYALLGIIPCGLLALYLYIFVGPAELTEIPEGYEPKEYEYHRHPLTRFLARIKTQLSSEQEGYERTAAYRLEEHLRVQTKVEFNQIKHQESLLGDYRGYYFLPVNPRPVSQHHAQRQIADMAGDFPHSFQSEDPQELPDKLKTRMSQF